MARARRSAQNPSDSIDFELLARELVRTLRGRRSQVAFSRRLGFGTNVVYAWESGRRWPTASLFFRAAALAMIDLGAGLVRFIPGAAPPPQLDLGTREGVASFLAAIRGGVPIVDVARRAGMSRYAVMRYLGGGAEPRLPDLLRAIEACSLRLLDFVALFVDPARLDSTARRWRIVQAQRRVVFDRPWVAAVLRAMELPSYRALPAHEPGRIARSLGIEVREEEACIEALAAAGQIRREGRRWVTSDAVTVDTRPDPAAERKLKAFWAKVGLERLSAGHEGLFSFNVFTVSEVDLERLRDLHRSYFRTLRNIVAASSPAERAVVANVQLFALDEPSPR
jgi:transcriptional regulator with XRE-family HTH domain